MLLHPKESGQGLLEYGLILVLVAIIIVLVLSVYGGQVSNLFSRITSAIP